MSEYRCVLCDVFTDQPLAGNQLAVFTDATAVPESQLQPLAREIGFSETVFAYPPSGSADARIRIFTPLTELRFAGHPTLGSAVVLADDEADAVVVETGAGSVPVRIERREPPAVLARMSQPVPTAVGFERVEQLLVALGVDAEPWLPVQVYDNGMAHVFIAMASAQAVAALAPDMAALERDFAGLGVNCFAADGAGWKTRMFGPGIGVAEDPATGSAAGPLAVHLASHGRIAVGEEITITQGAELLRPSTLYARVVGGTHGLDSVEVGGWTVLVGTAAFRAIGS